MRGTARKYVQQHPHLAILYVIEILILIFTGAACIRENDSCMFTVDDMEIRNGGAGIVAVKSDNACMISGTEIYDDIAVLDTDTFKLHPGAYNVRIRYSSQVSYDTEKRFSNSTGSLHLSSRTKGVYFDFVSLDLKDSMNEEVQSVQIMSPTAIDDLRFRIDFTGPGTLVIQNIQVQEIALYRYVCFLGMLLIMAIVNILLHRFQKGDHERKKVMLCLGVICLFAVMPFVANFSYYGHDLEFHLNRIVCLSDELKLGNYFPAVFTTALNGYGYAAPLFYGQIFLYIPAVLYSVGFSLALAYNILLALLTIATCLIMYYSALSIFGNCNYALLAAALYTLNPVRLTNIFTRAAVGEFTAQTFLPLIVLGMYNIYSADGDEKIPMKKYIPIAAGLTGVLLSHTLSFLMCGILMAVFCIIKLRATISGIRLAVLSKAAGITLLLNLFFLVPFLDSYQMRLNVNGEISHIQDEGAYLLQLMNPVVTNLQRDVLPNTAENEMSLSPGFPIVLGLILYVAWLLLKENSAKDAHEHFSRDCFTVTVASLVLSTIYFPYDSLDILPEGIYRLLTVYQFPWRWLVFAALFGVFLVICVIDNLNHTGGFANISGIAAYTIVFTLFLNMGQIYADQLQTSPLGGFSCNSYNYTMEIGNGEYLPLGMDADLCDCRNVLYDTGNVEIFDYMQDGRENRFYAKVYSGEEQKVVLPLTYYDNYLAYMDDGRTLEVFAETDGRAAVMLPVGYEGSITVIYHFKMLWKCAGLVSAVTFIILMVCPLFRKISMDKQRRKKD